MEGGVKLLEIPPEAQPASVLTTNASGTQRKKPLSAFNLFVKARKQQLSAPEKEKEKGEGTEERQTAQPNSEDHKEGTQQQMKDVGQESNKTEEQGIGDQLGLENSKKGKGKVSLVELSKEWGQLTEEQKAPFVLAAQEEKRAFEAMPHGHAEDAKEADKKRGFALNRIKQKAKLVATDKKFRKKTLDVLRSALELFLVEFGKSVDKIVLTQKRKTVQLKDIIAAIQSQEQYHFASCNVAALFTQIDAKLYDDMLVEPPPTDTKERPEDSKPVAEDPQESTREVPRDREPAKRVIAPPPSNTKITDFFRRPAA